ncbi:MAG: sigma-54-dependent Fis family transcriptional regulator [Pirellulales bacterium]|nr:sigma-54-dependent Fis family transcriptional regulator [Pirellulales bacterium]
MMSPTAIYSEGSVLVVDDHLQARESIMDVLRCGGFDVACAASAPEALACMKERRFDVVVTDLQMPGMSGLEFICQIESRNIPTQVVMVTAHASIASAVEAMRHGAFDYIEKPFNADQLETCVRQARDRGRVLQSSDPEPNSTNSPIMVGSSPAMQRLRDRIAQVAPTDETVLILGESGVGKELVAKEVHAQSHRKHGPFACLNCPVLSAQLMESELFGHIKGAFTGADSDRTGRFQIANGGTLLLDEVTEIDLPLQAKLLRVLQERSFEPVGSSQTIRVDVRVVATTNRDLSKEIAEGRFREDLYYRLAVIPIEVPPLRERHGDVAELIDHFLTMASLRLNRPRCELDPSAQELMVQYRWPGNVRELQNIVTRACVLWNGKPISRDQLQPWLAAPDNQDGPLMTKAHSTIPVGTSLEEMERHMIEATLSHFGGHRARTAAALGIGVRTLSAKLRSYGYAPREKSYAS